MRTTLSLDPDVEALLRETMARRGIGLKQAVNDGLRAGLGGRPTAAFRTPAHDMGRPSVPLDKALRLAGAMEDEELIRRLTARK